MMSDWQAKKTVCLIVQRNSDMLIDSRLQGLVFHIRSRLGCFRVIHLDRLRQQWCVVETDGIITIITSASELKLISLTAYWLVVRLCVKGHVISSRGRLN